MAAPILATLMMGLASLGATLLLSRLAPGGPADFRAALLRLAQALPLAVGVLYEVGAWWVGPVAVLLGVALGLAVAAVAGRATLPLGVVALAAGLSALAAVILRAGPAA